MEIGQRISGQVNNINDKGIYVTLNDSYFGHMPYNLKKSSESISKWDWVELVVFKIYENKSLLLCDCDYWNEKCRMDEFCETANRGDIYEAIVSEVNDSSIKVMLGNDIEGKIARDDISWNKVERPEDVVYVGEPLKVVFLEVKNGMPRFALRYLEQKPYPDDMYDLTIKQLLNYAGHSGTSFIGQAQKFNTYWLLKNICSANPGEEGSLLTDPNYGYNLRATAPISVPLVDGQYYEFTVKLVDKDVRMDRNQLYQFQATNFKETRDPYSFDTLQIFKKNTSPRTNVTAAHLLEEVGQNMYSSKDRMFYELIQNADDASSQRGVSIKVETNGDYLTLSHNGFSFDRNDFEAITSAANGTKKANENKTGYKGIGFKSVFTDSEQVYIKTGGYQFKFDKTQPQFQDFDKFYFFVNELRTQEEKENFLNRFASEKKNFKGVKDIPWQMEPIWVRSFPEEITQIEKNPNVCIALKLGADKIEGTKGYKETIDGIMDSPKFMLFLRNTKRIDFNDRSVSKSAIDGIVTLKNSFSDNRVETFKRRDFSVPISDYVFKEMGIDIRRKIIEKDGEKVIDATFVNGKGQEYENIPKKISIADSTEISFAVQYDEDNCIVKPDTKCFEVSMFAYLPTLVKDFKFPYFINANFVLDSSRERIKGDNPWNCYLMARIAHLMVTWVAELGSQGDSQALNMLAADYLSESSSDTEALAKHFNESYKNALDEIEFIPAMDGTMAYQKDIILDETGLAEIVGASQFCKIIGTEKKLPSSSIDSKILKKKLFAHIETYSDKKAAKVFVANAELGSWLGSASKDELDKFFAWIKDNHEKYPGLAESLPIFTFGAKHYSVNEIKKDSTLILTNAIIFPIKDILGKIGFTCSDEQIESSPLREYVVSRSDKEIFEMISSKVSNDDITTQEKVLLLSTLEQLKDVGRASISGLSLFKNVNGDYTPLNSLVAFRSKAPKWISPFMICKEDYSNNLDKYLVDSDHEFSDVVWKNLKSIQASIVDLYDTYKWTDSSYTKKLIDSCSADGKILDMLSVIEVSDLATRQYFLKKIKLEISSKEHYGKESNVCRVLRLAKSSLNKPSDFSTAIFVDGTCIKTIAIKDTITCEFLNDGKTEKVSLPVSRILPGIDNNTSKLSDFKSAIDKSTDIDCFIDANERDKSEIFFELNKSLNIPERNFSKWPAGRGNAIQYLYSVYYRKKARGWFSSYVPSIDLKKESQEFISELMEFLYENKICLSSSSFTHNISDYVDGLFFDNDYAFFEECIPAAIESWADNKKKVKYLIENGARESSDNAIKLREAFDQNSQYNGIEEISDKDAFAALEYFALHYIDSMPVTSANRKRIIESIIQREKCPVTWNVDIEKLKSKSIEMDTSEYKEWVSGHYPAIYIYPDTLPSLVSIKVGSSLIVILKAKDGDYYTHDKKTLYINGKKDINDLLFDIAKDKQSTFDLDDYKILCMNGKTVISKETYEGMSNELDKLKAEVIEKDELIRNYEKRLGIGEFKTVSDNSSPTPNIMKGTPEALSKDEQKDSQIDAQKFLMEIEPTWDFPEGYGQTDDLGQPYCFSCEEVETPDGTLPIVLKSHIWDDAPLKINPQEWEYITKKNALLLIYTGNDMKRLKVKDLIKGQSNISMSFSTENLDIEDRIDAFASSLHYFKELHFDFKSFNLSEKAESIKGIMNLNDGEQAKDLSDEDL